MTRFLLYAPALALLLLQAQRALALAAKCSPNDMKCTGLTSFKHCDAGSVWQDMECPDGTMCVTLGKSSIMCDHLAPLDATPSVPVETTEMPSSTFSASQPVPTTTRTRRRRRRRRRTRFVTPTPPATQTGPLTPTTCEELTSTATTTVTTTDSPTTQDEEPTTLPDPETCVSNGFLIGVQGPCSGLNNSQCCVAGRQYSTFNCSPAVTDATPAKLTLNGFGQGEDGGGAGACFGEFYSNADMVAAVSTGWFAGGTRCGQMINISANGRTVSARIVDHCDSGAGCDPMHDFQPPCDPNIVDVSAAVWEALGIPVGDERYGWMDVTWRLGNGNGL